MSKTITARSEGELRELAERIARKLTGGEVLLLFGELGAGKTTFSQALAAALGVKEQITSPTFTVVAEYPIQNHEAIQTFRHIDLYRLSDGAASEQGVREALEEIGDARAVTVIEWADRLGGGVPAGAWKLVFQHGEDKEERIVTIEGDG